MTTKDEIKNRISMALRDPILQQGFEIICRENNELEKKNAELKERADKADLDSVLFFNQLCKAKAIIKDYKIVAIADHCEVCSVPEENRCINVLKLNEQAEQFLKETDK
jgi:hypothetical protein